MTVCRRFQKGVNKREKALSGKSRLSHSVHCPYYTDDKQEYWSVNTIHYLMDTTSLFFRVSVILLSQLQDPFGSVKKIKFLN